MAKVSIKKQQQQQDVAGEMMVVNDKAWGFCKFSKEDVELQGYVTLKGCFYHPKVTL